MLPVERSLPEIVEGVWSDPAPLPLTIPDYTLIKQALARSGRHAHRNILVAQTLLGTGLRIGECLGLIRDHFRRVGPDTLLGIRRSKKVNSPTEYIPLHPELAAALWAYMDGNGVGVGDRVFSITTRQYQKVFKAASWEALGRNAHPHQLRSLYITYQLTELGVPLAVAAKMVGHADERTTLKHYLNISLDQKAAINRSIPI